MIGNESRRAMGLIKILCTVPMIEASFSRLREPVGRSMHRK